MKLEAVEQLAVFYEPSPERRRKVGRLVRTQRQILFEYEPGFLGSKLELSPLRMPLRAGAVVGPPELDGLIGVFDDRLPDGWGRLLSLAASTRCWSRARPGCRGGAHLATLAARAEIKRSARIIDEVRAATSRFKRFADPAGVPVRLAKRVGETLARVPR